MRCGVEVFEDFKNSPIWADMKEVMGRMNADILASQASVPREDEPAERIAVDNLLNRGRLDAMSKMAQLPDICIEEIELERREAKDERESEE